MVTGVQIPALPPSLQVLVLGELLGAEQYEPILLRQQAPDASHGSGASIAGAVHSATQLLVTLATRPVAAAASDSKQPNRLSDPGYAAAVSLGASAAVFSAVSAHGDDVRIAERAVQMLTVASSTQLLGSKDAMMQERGTVMLHEVC